MASGWNLWVWLQCIGVASQCCYKEVYRNRSLSNIGRARWAAINSDFFKIIISKYINYTIGINDNNFCM